MSRASVRPAAGGGQSTTSPLTSPMTSSRRGSGGVGGNNSNNTTPRTTSKNRNASLLATSSAAAAATSTTMTAADSATANANVRASSPLFGAADGDALTHHHGQRSHSAAATASQSLPPIGPNNNNNNNNNNGSQSPISQRGAAATHTTTATAHAPLRGPSAGSTMNASFASHLSTGPSFVELIRAREQQQQRIRAALEGQNEALLARLREANASGKEGAASVQIGEFLSFIGDIKEMIVRGNEAEVSAFRALNDKIERNELASEQRRQEVESRLIAYERGRDLLREEQSEQMLALSSEVERLREASARTEALVASHADTNEQTVLFSERVANALKDMEERVASVEALPTTVRQTLVEMEVRLNQVQVDVQEELRAIRERYPDTEDKLTLVMTRAEQNLLLLQHHADAAIKGAENQQKHIEEVIDTTVTSMGRALEGMFNAKYAKHALRLSEENSAARAAVAEQEASVMAAIEGLKAQVDAYLANLELERPTPRASRRASLT